MGRSTPPHATAAATRQDAGRRTARSAARPATVLVASDWAPIRAFEPIVREIPRRSTATCCRSARRRPAHRQLRVRADVGELGRVEERRGVQGRARARGAHGGAVRRRLPREQPRAGLRCRRASRDPSRARARGSARSARAHRRADAGAAEPERQRSAIHIVNISEGEDLTPRPGGTGVFGWDIAAGGRAAARAQELGGVVIVIAHCGLEYVPFPPPYVVAAFRALVEAGADCVIGHHPHVPQGIEWWQGRPIVYSLGNFVFFQPTTLLPRKIGFCVSLRCEGGAGRAIELHPYRITDTACAGSTRGSAGLRQGPDTALAALQNGRAGPRAPGTPGWSITAKRVPRRGHGHPRQDDGRSAKGAAMFRNRITTMQHVEHWQTFLTRMVDGGRRILARGLQTRRGVPHQDGRFMLVLARGSPPDAGHECGPSAVPVSPAARLDDGPDEIPVVGHLAFRRPEVQRVDLRRPALVRLQAGDAVHFHDAQRARPRRS